MLVSTPAHFRTSSLSRIVLPSALRTVLMPARFLKGIGQQTDWALCAGFSKNTYGFQAHSNQQIIQSGSRSLRLRERGFIRLVFQPGAKPIELAGVKRSFNRVQTLVLGASCLPLDQLRYVSQSVVLVQGIQICFHYPRPHQVYSRQQYAKDIQQGLYLPRVLFLEQPPLIFGKAEIMMCVMAGDAALRDPFQLFVLWCRMHHEWRVQLLKDISVRFQKQLKELLNVMRYQIEVDRLFLGNLHGVPD